MKEFEGKIAVVTGGASGIGYALANEALQRGMKVVIADINPEALDAAKASLGGGPAVLCAVTDVSDPAAVAALAERTQEHFGTAQLVFNNAGVSGGGTLWEQGIEDWNWVVGINLNGVLHGIRSFTQGMIDSGEGHIVNTASIAGLISAPSTGSYTATKHAVVALSEVLQGDLRNAGANVGVSVLCPSFVNTSIYVSGQYSPGMTPESLTAQQKQEQEELHTAAKSIFDHAMPPDIVARIVFEGIEAGRFYILTHPDGTKPLVEQRMKAILNDDSPSLSGPEAYPLEWRC